MPYGSEGAKYEVSPWGRRPPISVLALQGSRNTKTPDCKQCKQTIFLALLQPTMQSKNEVIDDSTDPGGTLRPNIPPEPIGTHFDPLPCPEFEYYINLPPSVDQHSPIAIFDLFFTPEQMHILVENTNKSGPFHQMGPRNARSLEWQDTFVEELYAYLGILIYMGLHLENDIDQY
jgi:hypothetical protein